MNLKGGGKMREWSKCKIYTREMQFVMKQGQSVHKALIRIEKYAHTDYQTNYFLFYKDVT